MRGDRGRRCWQAASSRRPKLLFLTSPNNPDGSLLAPGDLARLLELPLMVVLDEAYVEFAGLECSLAGWVRQHTNLVVLRTFSKWAGIAGLRLGYGIFPDWLMPVLWRAKQPYNVNVAATVAGLVSLRTPGRDPADRRGAGARTRAAGAGAGARAAICSPIPAGRISCSAGCAAGMRRELKAALAREGILVRYFAKPGLENCIRVSAGRPEHTDALLAGARG